MKKAIEVAKLTLEKEAQAISDAVDRLSVDFERAIELVLKHKGKLVICGVGKSGLVGQKISATLSSTGTPCVFLHACDAVHGDLGIYEAGDPTLLISNSGSTVECLRLIPVLKNLNSKIIALVGNVDSPIAKASDIVIDASTKGEADPLGIVPTTSTTLALALGDAFACALMSARGFSSEDFARYHPAGQLGRNLLLKVEDVMHFIDDCALVDEQTSVRDVVIAMTKKPLGAACVVDENCNMKGLITDGDIRRMLQNIIDIDKTKCADIMTSEPINIGKNEYLTKAISLMESKKTRVSVLPVIEDGKCLGLVRLHDIYQGS